MVKSQDMLWRKYIQIREVNVFAALILLVIIMSAASPYFLKQENIFNLLRGMSTIGIMAINKPFTRFFTRAS